MKPSPIFLLIEGEADGPHEATDILDRISGEALDEDENPIEPLPEKVLSCIEGMSGWRSLEETLIWSYAKLLMAMPQAEEWIKQIDAGTLNLRDGNREIRETLKRTINLEDWQAPNFIWKAINANASLLRRHREYEKREQHWDVGAMEFYPAFELRFFQREVPTRDWSTEWLKLGGRIYSDKLIARKDDSIWQAISDFGYPFEPFDFDHSVWVGDVSSQDAAKHGLIVDPKTLNLPPLKSFNMVGL